MADSDFRQPPPGTRRHYWRVDPDLTDEELEAWASHFVDAVLGDAIEMEDDETYNEIPFMRVATGYDAVLLDAGGVLLLSDPDAIRRVVSSFGLEPDDEACLRSHYLRTREFDRLGGPDWPLIDSVAAAALGMQEEDLERATDLLGSVFPRESIPAPGVVDVLRRLEEMDIVLGVVPNANGALELRLADHGICSVDGSGGVKVGVVFDSSVVGIEKPDPRTFDVALESLGVASDRALYVGDTVVNDVNGARAASLHPLHFDPHGLCLDDSHPHVASLADVADLIERA